MTSITRAVQQTPVSTTLLRAAALSFLVSVLAVAVAQAASCPVINGKYIRDVDRGEFIERYSATHFTRQTGGVFSYTVDARRNFYVADGVARRFDLRGRDATIKLVCDHNSLIAESRANGSDFTFRVKLTPINETQLRLESNILEQNGIYTKE